MDFPMAVRTCFCKYASFAGRASRAEFWYFALFAVLGNIATSILDSGLGTDGALNAVFSFLLFLPQIAVTARRLHDVGRSGWWQAAILAPALATGVGTATGSAATVILAGLVCLVLAIVLLAWMCRAGDPGPNHFGESPLGLITPAMRA